MYIQEWLQVSRGGNYKCNLLLSSYQSRCNFIEIWIKIKHAMLTKFTSVDGNIMHQQAQPDQAIYLV